MGWKLPGGRRPEQHHLFPTTPPATGLQEPVFVSARLAYHCLCPPACLLLYSTHMLPRINRVPSSVVCSSAGLQAGVVYKAEGLDLAVHAQLAQAADVAAPGGAAEAGVVAYLGGHQVGGWAVMCDV